MYDQEVAAFAQSLQWKEGKMAESVDTLAGAVEQGSASPMAERESHQIDEL